MKETRGFEVSTSRENSEIEVRTDFAWDLKSSQQLTNGNVKLLMQRENTIPNYKKIVSIETEYNAIFDKNMWHLFGRGLFMTILVLIFSIILVPVVLIRNSNARKTNFKNAQKRSELRSQAVLLINEEHEVKNYV